MELFRLRKLVRILSLSCGFLMILLFAHSALGKENSPKPAHKRSSDPDSSPDSEKEFFNETMKYVGCNYQKGGSSPAGFDCSGFVKRIYQKILDVALPHNASEQYSSPGFEKIDLYSLKTGDLVFFSTTSKKKTLITHVGIYLSDGNFVHAATRNGVIISNLNSPYYKNRYAGARRMAGSRRLPPEVQQESLSAFSYAYSEKSIFSLLFTEAELSRFAFSGMDYRVTEVSSGFYRGVALEYSAALLENLTVRATAFRDYFLPMGMGFSSSRDGGLEELRAYHLPYSPYAEGIKIASELRPSHWLSVTPSLVYLTKTPRLENTDIPQMLLGLDVALVSSVEGWSLTTGIQYPLRDRSPAASARPSDDDGFDLSLNYRQWLNEKMQLSVTGENLFRLSPRIQSSSYRDEREEGRFSLMLNFFY
jgi:NlpC/P60 family